MSESLKHFLDEHPADADSIQQAVRYYIAERSDDLTPDEMREKLVEAAGNPRAVEQALLRLSQDAALLDSAALAGLSFAWEDAGQAERVQSAILNAKDKLPVIESAALAMYVLYAMYLATTGGKKKVETVVERRPDGTVHERRTMEYWGPSGPLGMLVNLFKSGAGAP